MKMTLAAAALIAASGVALAQGTSTAPGTTAPGTVPPAATSTAPSTTSTTMAPNNSATGAQTPGATVNTTPGTNTRNPSAVQTTNTTHRTARAPVPGRNSFTMAQASGRIASAGYSNVTGLKKDNQGIWRGQAQKDGNTVGVSLDYQGNVTAQ